MWKRLIWFCPLVSEGNIGYFQTQLGGVTGSISVSVATYASPASFTVGWRKSRRNSFLIYWSIIDLQHCVNFYCIANWFSYTYFFSYFFPLWFITRYWLYSTLCLSILWIMEIQLTSDSPPPSSWSWELILKMCPQWDCWQYEVSVESWGDLCICAAITNSLWFSLASTFHEQCFRLVSGLKSFLLVL